MVEKIVVIRNPKGIHVRPSSLIAQALRGYEGKAYVTSENGKRQQLSASPLSVMGLALAKGCVLTLQVEGPEEGRKLAELAELFEKTYEFT